MSLRCQHPRGCLFSPSLSPLALLARLTRESSRESARPIGVSHRKFRARAVRLQTAPGELSSLGANQESATRGGEAAAAALPLDVPPRESLNVEQNAVAVVVALLLTSRPSHARERAIPRRVGALSLNGGSDGDDAPCFVVPPFGGVDSARPEPPLTPLFSSFPRDPFSPCRRASATSRGDRPWYRVCVESGLH